MKLSDEWFTSLSENEAGQLVTVMGRDNLSEFRNSGKLNDRIEVTWKYEPDANGLITEPVGKLMEAVETSLQKALEKDKLAIMTSIYTGGGEKIWVFYVRNINAFGECLNEALTSFELLPISIYTEHDPDWEEYLDMYEMKDWRQD
ncbi:MAG: DUF695 domain-containing protein [Massilibacteroides sp.]|nr:DUF695 domain-containing protein [Massilibacteroides sp.]MDD3062740.1 DUF695 domain-containing protein [Massilibacteroides sp.]MDD4114170.1 DUF695 domain-containing protein [Massilibacteroides sp.]MDD4661284.1 DUF695 domain-containing protein [Massilibacteroides sp.]